MRLLAYITATAAAVVLGWLIWIYAVYGPVLRG